MATLMRRMGIEALYRRPRTSIPARGSGDLPLSAVGPCDRTAQPGLGERYHVSADGPWLSCIWWRSSMSRSRKVLAFRLSNTLTADFCVEALRGGDGEVRDARDLQHRPGIAVHLRGVDRALKAAGVADQHGRQGSLDRQRVHRAAVAERQVRGGLPARLRERHRSARAALTALLPRSTTRPRASDPSTTARRTRCISANWRRRHRWRRSRR